MSRKLYLKIRGVEKRPEFMSEENAILKLLQIRVYFFGGILARKIWKLENMGYQYQSSPSSSKRLRPIQGITPAPQALSSSTSEFALNFYINISINQTILYNLI